MVLNSYAKVRSIDYNGAYIVLKEASNPSATLADGDEKAVKNIVFKNNEPFRSCILKNKNALMGNLEDLEVVMLMYNLLKYNYKFSMTLEISRSYYEEEIDGTDADDKT